MTSDRKVSVLLVDDQPNNLLALEAMLGGMDLDLVRARSGEEALIRVLDTDFAVILMDVQMPGMDGFETAALIRRRDRSHHTPIIFLTAFQNTDAQVVKGYELGAVDFLFKPIVPAILKSKVGVFVELFQKTEQIRQQADQLFENQRREHERALAEQKRRWELERLREEAFREKENAEALAQKAEELTRTIAERQRAEQQLRAVRDELAVQLADMTRLHALGARLSTSIELPTVLEEVLAAVTSLQGTDRGVLMLHDPERGTMTTAASVGFTPEQLEAVDPVPSGASGAEPVTAVICGGIVVEEATADPVLAPHLSAALKVGCRAVCSTPLLTFGGALIGTIATYFPQCHRPTERETRMVELYARQAAEFIDNARLYRRIREADRHKDEFLAMLAHELRNPLAPLLNALHVLRHPERDAQAAEQARQIAEKQVRHLARLVDDLLDVSRISRGKIQLRMGRVDLAEAVAQAIETARPLITARSHDLTVLLPDEPLVLVADAVRIEQVFANLLNNAAKYTEPGGRITLEAHREGRYAVVRVRDTGIGIAPELLPRIFDLFAQEERSLDRSQGGLGIGLTLVRRLVEMHGGSIIASSPGVGRGSEFVVRLPVHAADRHPGVSDVPPRATPRGPQESQPKRVLVVDDYVDGAQLLGRVVEGFGHDVQLAHDGPAALEAAMAYRPDIVLLDIGLPEMDGYEVARRLKALEGLEQTVLVALTGYGQDDDRRRSHEAGIELHLVKPVDPEALEDLLARSRNLVGQVAHSPA